MFQERAEYFVARSRTALQAAATAALTRPLVLVMSYGWSVPWMRSHPEAAVETVKPFTAAPRRSFLPQRIRAIRRAKILAATAGGLAMAGAGWYLWLLLR